MSRAAQEVARQVRELQHIGRKRRTNVEHDGIAGVPSEAQKSTTAQVEQDITEQKEMTMAKKKAVKPKSARASRVAATGDITGVESNGETYLQLNFTEGHVTLTPTANRTPNRDLVVKAIKALLK